MLKPGLLLLLFTITGISLYAQHSLPGEFAYMAAYSEKKANSYITKKGYRHTSKDYIHDTITDTWEQVVAIQPDSGYSGIRRLVRFSSAGTVSFAVHTPLYAEYLAAISGMEKEGYRKGPGKDKKDSCSFFYQRGNETITTSSGEEEGQPVFTLFFSQKKMPAVRSVRFGNDLLQFTSHAYLEHFFGAANVKKDLYYFSEKELQKCSVLFPNTPQQAVFIWNDEENLNDLSHIIVSGSPNTGSQQQLNSPVARNTWGTSDGVYINMPLSQLLSLNDAEISFYGRNSENYLTVLPQRKGRVDFTRTGIVFDCFNCGTDPLLNKQTVSASEAVKQNLRLHVAMIILIPGEEKTAEDQWAKR